LGRAILPTLALTLGFLFAITRTPNSPAALTALFGLLGVAYLPGLAAALWVENCFGLWASWILPLILAPVLSVGAALLLNLSGVRLDDTSPWIVLLAVLAVVFAPHPRREIEDYAVSMEMPGFLRRRSDRQQVIVLATAVLALIALPLLARAWIRVSGDAAVDIATTQAILRHGLPVGDPLMAGLPLRSFWAFHAYLAVLQGATRVAPDVLLAGGSLIAAFVLVFTGYRLLTLLALPHARAVWGATFLFFSLNGPFFLDRFLTAGPFVLALVYMLLFLMATVASLGENRLRWNLLAFLAALGMLLFHGGLAIMVLAVTFISIPVVWIAGRLNPFRGPGWELTGTVLPMVLALLVGAPYLAHILRAGPFEPALFLRISPGKVVTVAAALLPALIFGVGVLGSFLAATEVRRQAWTVWTVLLFTLCLVVEFPGANPLLGPITLAYVPLALAAGSAVPLIWQRTRGVGRALFALALVVVLVPRTALGVAGYLGAPPPPAFAPDAREAVAWLHEHTPADAVVVDLRPDLALAAYREALYGRRPDDWTVAYRSNAMVRRSGAHYDLLRGADLGPEEVDLLRALHAPIYVVRRLPQAPMLRLPLDAKEVFANRGYRVWLWLPSAADSLGRGR
jgi:hypothetical protein